MHCIILVASLLLDPRLQFAFIRTPLNSIYQASTFDCITMCSDAMFVPALWDYYYICTYVQWCLDFRFPFLRFNSTS